MMKFKTGLERTSHRATLKVQEKHRLALVMLERRREPKYIKIYNKSDIFSFLHHDEVQTGLERTSHRMTHKVHEGLGLGLGLGLGYIFLYILVLSSFRASPRIGDASPRLSKLRDGWFAYPW